jgi:hypothetical protein
MWATVYAVKVEKKKQEENGARKQCRNIRAVEKTDVNKSAIARARTVCVMPRDTWCCCQVQYTVHSTRVILRDQN